MSVLEAPLVVLMTGPDIDKVRAIARALVEERLAACCNIVSGVESIYRWEGALETATEVLAIIKTNNAKFPDLERRVRELHPYDVPEIVAMSVIAGSENYLRWVLESL